MRGIVVVLAAGLALGGCGVDYRVRMMDQYGQISAERSRALGADYVVSVKNVGADIGVDPDDKPTRDRMVMSYIGAQCPGAKIVGEDTIETGRAVLTGTPFRTYQVRVKC